MCLYSPCVRHSDSSIVYECNTRVTRERQAFLITLPSAILNVCCSTTRRSGNSLQSYTSSSKEGADPPRPHPCGQKLAISPVAVHPPDKRPKQSSGRSSVLPRDATKITPMAGWKTKSSGSSLHFTCNTSEQGK
jgi:hypothetical protein